MAKASRCRECDRQQLTALPRFAELSHSGWCQDCAEAILRRSVRALAYYRPDIAPLVDLVEGELHNEEPQQRVRRLSQLQYPDGAGVGVLVAISRLYAADAIEQHQDVLADQGIVAFGKFRYARETPKGGTATPRPLETLERERHEGVARDWFLRRARGLLDAARPMHLFVIDPDPPARMWVGSVADVHVRPGSLCDHDFAVPEFGDHQASDIVPDYYWLDPGDKRHLRYHCNFWFLLSSIREIDASALADMTDLETADRITLATSQLYPAEVLFEYDAIAPLAQSSSGSRSGPGVVAAVVDKLVGHLQRVFFTAAARGDLEKSPQDMIDQVVCLLVDLERDGKPAGGRGRKVADGDGLIEFSPTGPGRVAAAWLANRWLVVGLDSQHREHFWRRMKQRWRDVHRVAG